MQLVTGRANKAYISDIQSRAIIACTRARVAMAYAGNDNMSLFELCSRHGKPLDFFGRYDHTVPISPDILAWFLEQKNLNFRCRLIQEWLHAKIIWWVGFGAYIGSANLTDRAWFKNLEGGLFATEEELIFHGIDEELDNYFSLLEEESHPLSEEIYKEQVALHKKRRENLVRENEDETSFWKNAKLPRKKSLVAVDREQISEKAFVRFEEEWNRTLQVMRDIGHHLTKEAAWPVWLKRGVSLGAITDQFLHAYYYNQVAEGSSYPYEDYFHKNKDNPNRALLDAIEWWKKGEFDHEHERAMLEEHSIRVRELLAQEKITKLTIEEFTEVTENVFAMRDHAIKLPNKLLALPDVPQDRDTKIRKFAELLWQRRSKAGHDVRQTLTHVIWGGGSITRRLWEGQKDPTWKIEDISRSTLGEIVGWARPDEYPPRNQRSSKALRALGYGDVMV
jgi:hypothetical protein